MSYPCFIHCRLNCVCILVVLYVQESEKKRQEERMQQKRWQEIHRHQVRMHETSHDPDAALRRLLQTRDTGRTDWYTVEFETTHV